MKVVLNLFSHFREFVIKPFTLQILLKTCKPRARAKCTGLRHLRTRESEHYGVCI